MTCLGTKLVVLTADDRRLPSEGILIVYDKSPSQEEATKLQVQVCTNDSALELDVSLQDAKVSDKSMIAKYLLDDRGEHQQISVKLNHEMDESTAIRRPALRLVMQQKLPSGLLKHVYSGILTPITGSSPVLKCVHQLGQVVNTLRDKQHQLQLEVAEQSKNRQHWQETAGKLHNDVWQKEKDRLVSSFLAIWKEQQQRSKKEIQDLQGELAEAKATLQRTKGGKRKALAPVEEAADDLEASEEPIPLDDIAALASGKKTTQAKTHRKPVLKVEDTVSSRKLQQQAEEYTKRQEDKKKKRKGKEDENMETKKKRKTRVKTEEPEEPDVPTSVKEESASPVVDSDEEDLRAMIRAGINKSLSFSDEEDDTNKRYDI
eukprot:Nitzschia sp. Nitz4//scaffold35_size145790//100785//101909//NITZ4_003042-RA/size145790-processed-gene-0.61-mRNA-1//1//CDS//3329549160//2590//frame0